MISEQVSTSYNTFTPLLLEVFGSQYLNFGYWNRKGLSIEKAQSNLVKAFGEFCGLRKGLEVVDVGCGTGEQDIDFVDQFHCKRIIGMNNSKVQVEIALGKVKSSARYRSKIDFLCENAENLIQYPKEFCDRVVALESSQHFDKHPFLAGAFHVLKPNGYLCIAEVIRKGPRLLYEAKLSDIEKELPIQNSLRSLYKSELKRIRDFIFESFKEKSVKAIAHQNYSISYKEYLTRLNEAGFSIEEIQDITRYVMGIYPAVRKRVVEMLSQRHPYSHVLLYLFVALYLLHCAFARKSTGFYFIRAKKLDGKKL